MKQLELFNNPEWYEEHWQDMPEYKSEDLKPFKTVYVHFRNREDLEQFCKVINQEIAFTSKLTSIWFPEMKYEELKKRGYIQK